MSVRCLGLHTANRQKGKIFGPSRRNKWTLPSRHRISWHTLLASSYPERPRPLGQPSLKRPFLSFSCVSSLWLRTCHKSLPHTGYSIHSHPTFLTGRVTQTQGVECVEYPVRLVSWRLGIISSVAIISCREVKQWRTCMIACCCR